MKILHIEDCFDPEAGYQVNELSTASARIGDEVLVVTSNDMTPFHKDVSPEKDAIFEGRTGVRVKRLPLSYKIAGRRVLKGVNREIKKFSPDLVLMHGIGDFKDLVLFGRRRPYKIIRDSHMSWIAAQNPFRRAYYWFYRHTFAPLINRTDKYQAILALGDEEYDYLEHLGISPSKIQLLRHGFDKEIVRYDDAERTLVRAGLEIPMESAVISYIGKFNALKRPDLVLDIVELMDPTLIRQQDLRVLFLGSMDSDYEEFFYSRVRDSPIRDRVVVRDAQPFTDLYRYYSASDICIFPKQTTLSSIHAQVCGCEVIMERQASNIERVLNQDNLFTPGNLRQATDILERLVQRSKSLEPGRYYSQLLKREYRNQAEVLRSFV